MILIFSARSHAAASVNVARLGRRARTAVWTLAALFLWATLAPAISRTLDHHKPLAERGWVQVCSAGGMSWMPAAAGRGNRGMAAASLLHYLDACNFCVLATDRGTPPPGFQGWGLVALAPPPCPLWCRQAVPPAPASVPVACGPPLSA